MTCYFTLTTGNRTWPLRTSIGSRLAMAALACFMVAAGAVPASAKKHASMAIDANTGKVLYNSSGDELRHPASLTKIMTLYMAFELIEAGKLSYDTKISFSSRCASRPPSKLGLDPGESIRLIDAMKALITKSANDVACAVGEHISGSEWQFANAMTEKARAIGMKRTVFRNASGLPNDEQVTTARDMLTLAMRIQDDFPERYKLFKTRSFRFRGKTYRNHNKLLGKMRGIDGIKTGYIRASGFNLVSSIKRDGKYVVAAVFGGRTSATRNAEMTSLLYKSLKRASTKKTRKPMLVAQPRAVIRPAAPARHPSRAAEPARAQPEIAVARVRPNEVVPGYERAPRQEQSGQVGRAPGTLQDQLAMLLARSGVADAASDEGSRDDSEPQAAAGPIANGPYQVQVGAYTTREEAEQSLAEILRRSPDLLGSYAPVTEPVDSGSRTLYRARFSGFEQAAATSTCHALRGKQIDCFVTIGQR